MTHFLDVITVDLIEHLDVYVDTTVDWLQCIHINSYNTSLKDSFKFLHNQTQDISKTKYKDKSVVQIMMLSAHVWCFVWASKTHYQ